MAAGSPTRLVVEGCDIPAKISQFLVDTLESHSVSSRRLLVVVGELDAGRGIGRLGGGYV